MLKRKRNLFLINVTIFQIILLITTSFSISFLFSEYVGLGSAQISAFRSATAQRLLSKQGLSTTGASGATPPIGNVNEQLLADLGKQQYGGATPPPGTPKGGVLGIFKREVFLGGPKIFCARS